MIVKANAIPGSDSAYSVVADEPDELRRNLLGGFLADCEGNEEMCIRDRRRSVPSSVP